jgi:hypothetical protein
MKDRLGLDSTREGRMQGFSLGSYVKLMEVQPVLAHISQQFERGRRNSGRLIAISGRSPVDRGSTASKRCA